MESQRLEKYRKEFKYFDNTIQSVQAYLNKLSPANTTINPGKISSDLSIPEADVMFILSLAEKEHLMKKKFVIYDENHTYLGESENKIPDELENLDTGKMVDADNFYIDIVFEIDK